MLTTAIHIKEPANGERREDYEDVLYNPNGSKALGCNASRRCNFPVQFVFNISIDDDGTMSRKDAQDASFSKFEFGMLTRIGITERGEAGGQGQAPRTLVGDRRGCRSAQEHLGEGNTRELLLLFAIHSVFLERILFAFASPRWGLVG